MSRKSLPRNGFTFKQFFVAHDHCGMRVSTDSVLLGAWVDIDRSCQRLLDIGSGSGLLALMLAQRTLSQTVIDAVELEQQACAQARENVARSPWPDKISVIEQDIIEYTATCLWRYDVIISNPPYFMPGVSCRSVERNIARYSDSLSYPQLLVCVQRLLAPSGKLAVVLPALQVELFLVAAKKYGLYCRKRLIIKDTKQRPPCLQLLELTFEDGFRQEETLILKQEQGNYTQQYRQLTADFYLSTN